MKIGNWRIASRRPVWRLSRRYNQIGFGPLVLTHCGGGRLDGVKE